jgi:myo-inositol-1(or 4)-monophosphatase
MASLERRVAIDAARDAGRLLLTELRAVHRIAFKGLSTNLVTEMDERAEELIVGRLGQAFPDDTILAEERGAASGRSGRRWIVDPLDGTTNFLHGLPHWAVSIGLEHKGEVVAGVIYDPVKDEIFVAEKGAGAYLNDRRLRVSGRRDMIEMIFATGIPFGGRPELSRTLRELAALTPRTAGIRRWGSAALDLAYVAAGRCDGYWERGLNPWDVAAGLLLVREAGGLAGPIEDGGDPLNGGSIAAANPNVYDALRKVLREA